MKIATLVREMHVEPLDSIFSPRMYLSTDLYTMAKELDFELVAIISGQDCEEICKLCDGLIVPGSAKDIDPKYYGGEAMDPPQEIDEYALDAKVIDLFVKQGKPIFGICGGHQDLNIYFGGSISKIDYPPHQDANKYHEVIAEKDSFVYDVFGSTDILVNSHHGWAIDRLAPNLRVVARSKKDNVIEAVEDRERKIFATQWHPELSYRMGDPIERKFFENFIRLCANQ